MLLNNEDILKIHSALISAGIDRGVLLASLDPVIAASLPQAQRPSEQLLRDLHYLNATICPSGDSYPMSLLLRTAAHLTSARSECPVFEQALLLLGKTAPVASNGIDAAYSIVHCKRTLARFDILNDQHIRNRAPFRLRLSDVFVRVRLVDRPSGRVRVNPVEKVQIEATRSIFDFLQLVAAGSAIGLAVLGPPGSGKSTMLQHLAVAFARNHLEDAEPRCRIPLFVPLRQHSRHLLSTPRPTLTELLDTLCGSQRPPRTWHEDLLSHGKACVLIDGLDEVGDDSSQVAEWIDEQIISYPESAFIVTSRPRGYTARPIRAHELEILPFQAEQTEQFVQQWYSSHEVLASRNDDELRDAHVRSARAAGALLEQIRTSEALTALACNPLLLTMIVNVHSIRQSLPTGRAELYDEIVAIGLGCWHQPGAPTAKIGPTELRSVLMLLASKMSLEKQLLASTGDVLDMIGFALSRILEPCDAIDYDFLKSDVEARSGLLIESERGHWSFCHRSFQDYLTAHYWRSSRPPPDFQLLVGDKDNWWNEALLFYAMMAGADSFVQLALDAKNRNLLSRLLDETIISSHLRRISAIRLLELETQYRIDLHSEFAMTEHRSQLINRRAEQIVIEYEEQLRQIHSGVIPSEHKELHERRLAGPRVPQSSRRGPTPA